MNRERNTYFDILKGLAISIVVLGHCLQTFYPNWTEATVSKVIVSFHMPLFMLVSGYFFYPSVLKTDYISFIKKRFVHLYLPSLVWGAFSCFLIGVGKILGYKTLEIGYFISLFFTGMWYLTVLFLLQVIGAVVEHYFSKSKYIVWMLFYVIVYVAPNFWMGHELKFLTPFFVSAIALRGYDWSKCPLWIGLLALIIFVAVMQFYTFEHSLYRMTDNVFTIRYHLFALIRFIAGLCGSVFVLWLTTYIQQIRHLVRPLIYIGMTTLPIYVLHQKFLMMNKVFCMETMNVIVLLLFAIMDVLFSVMLYKILKKNKYLNLLLFGGK